MGMNFDDKTSAEIVKDLIDQVMAVAAKDALIGMHRGLGNDAIVELLRAENEPLVHKAGDTSNYIIHAMNQREAVEPYLDYDGKDVYRCGYCHRNIFHPSFTAEDDDEKRYRKYCYHCGRAVKWE